MNAVVVLLDDEPVGIIGISHEPGIGLLFSEFKDALEPHLRRMAVMRAVMAAMALVRKYPQPVAIHTETPEGERLATRLGFERVEEGLWVNSR